MASPPRTSEREEERRHNMRTLVIASVASASAAVVTSQLWIAGTWIAAAMTPVIVALVSELLNRPTERLARSISTTRAPALPVAGGAAPPARPDADSLPTRAPEEPAAPPVRVYRSGQAAPRTTRRRKVAYGAVFGTAAVAFLIAVVALTVPELVTGGSIGKNSGRTTLFSGDRNKDSNDSKTPADTNTDRQSQPEQQQNQQQPAPGDEQSTTPSEQPTTEQPAPQQGTTTTPPAQPLPQSTPPDTQP
jgi:hypothetical protein